MSARLAPVEDHFAGFAISEILGCRKPEPRMDTEGSRLLDRDADDPAGRGVIGSLDQLLALSRPWPAPRPG